MIEPLISLTLKDQNKVFQPGDALVCEYQIDAVSSEEVLAVEASVLWYTEGKGDEDLAVHYFERRTPSDLGEGDLCELRCFETQLPNCPLTYDGNIVNIRWCVRVRLFLRRGKEIVFERPFRLGAVPAANSNQAEMKSGDRSF